MTLSQLRKRLAKRTVAELADLSQLSRMTIGRIKKGTHAPNMATFERLCNAVAGRRSPPKAGKGA